MRRVEGGTVYLSSTKSTQFIDIINTRPLPGPATRRMYTAGDIFLAANPPFGEVDLVGVVLQVRHVKSRGVNPVLVEFRIQGSVPRTIEDI